MVLEIFTYTDIAFVVLALICFIVGLSKGFISQIFGFVGFAVSVLVAFLAAKPIAEGMRPVFSPIYTWAGESVGYIISLIIVFVAVALIVRLLLSLIQKLFSSLVEKLGVIRGIDRVLGMFLSLGILYSVFAVVIALIALAPEDFLPNVQAVLDQQVYDGKILSAIYAKNPLGEWVTGFITNG